MSAVSSGSHIAMMVEAMAAADVVGSLLERYELSIEETEIGTAH
jgi:hypothetical protein